MFFSCTTLSLLALSSLISAASLKHKRTSTSGIDLYVYGSGANNTATNGAQIFYADGLAYVGHSATLSSASVNANISYTLDGDETTTAWTIQSNTTSVTFNETLSMYIVPTNGSYTQVGFTSDVDTAPTGAVTTGFTLFGKSVAYAASDSNYELTFYASTTDDANIFALYWNAGSSDVPDGAFPVVVKATAPVKLTS